MFDGRVPVFDREAPVFDREVVEIIDIVVMRAGLGQVMAGLLAPHEAPDLPGPRSGPRRGTPCHRVGPWGGVLIEVRRHIQPAGVPQSVLGAEQALEVVQ